MSLINEALKRAKQAQEIVPSTPPPNLDFRTVEPARTAQRNQSMMLIAALCTVVILALLLVWLLIQSSGSSKPTSASPLIANAAPAAVQPAAPTPPEAPKLAPSSVSPQATVSEPIAPEPVKSAQPIAERQADTAPAIQAPPAEVAQTPKPAAPRLQSIVFNPKRPSAMISGRIVFIGDKFGEWRITAIDQESATLVSSSLTNVLILQQ
jgi:hypothetical protein